MDPFKIFKKVDPEDDDIRGRILSQMSEATYREFRKERRIFLFWETIHNIGGLLVFLVVLPFSGIIAIIDAWRENY